MPKLRPLFWSEHVAKWKNCKGCEYSKRRTQVVFGRGPIDADGRLIPVAPPFDVLFVGEAPGDHEDTHGKPFWGPAGRHQSCGLQSQIDQALLRSYFIVNLVGCIPLTAEMDKQEGGPLPECIDACAPKLEEVIIICRPKLIVAVGDLAKAHLEARGGPETVVAIRHPAYILRCEVMRRGLLVQENVVTIEEAVVNL